MKIRNLKVIISRDSLENTNGKQDEWLEEEVENTDASKIIANSIYETFKEVENGSN